MVNYEYILHFFLVCVLLTLNMHLFAEYILVSTFYETNDWFLYETEHWASAGVIRDYFDPIGQGSLMATSSFLSRKFVTFGQSLWKFQKAFSSKKKNLSSGVDGSVQVWREVNTKTRAPTLFLLWFSKCYKQVYQPVNKLNRYLMSNVFEDKKLNSLTENPLRSALWCRNDANIARIFPDLAQNSSYSSTLLLHLMRGAIWYHLYNFKNVKNTRGGVLL